MDLARWALFGLAVAASFAVALHTYRRREPAGRGRPLLAALRGVALSLLVLLLFDPELPAAGLGGRGSRPHVLVDGSLSMALPVRPGAAETRWARAVAEARRLAGGRGVTVFGGVPRVVLADSLAAERPRAPRSELLPALAAVAEAGARRVVVLTDGGVEDAAEVARALPELGLEVEVRPVAEGVVPDRALAEVVAPPWAEAGKPVEVRVGVAALGPAGDTISVVLRAGGRALARARVVTVDRGRIATAVLAFTPEAPPGPAGAAGEPRGGLVRYDLALEPGDAVPDDDRRSFYLFVSERPAGVVLVSFRPDWEPRFLLPVLGEALGLPVQGYVAAGGRFVRLGAGADAGRRAGEPEVRRLAAQADLLVLHGVGREAPAWARQAAAARRVLVFPADEGAPAGLPLSLPPPAPGEWYVHAELPPSPIAPLLGELRAEELPPLAGLRPVEPTAGAWAPLVAQPVRPWTLLG